MSEQTVTSEPTVVSAGHQEEAVPQAGSATSPIQIAPIRRLSDDVAAQIAAGEVIERPASVIKELVENATDAGASRIDVTIDAPPVDGAEGGDSVGAIRVTDNGGGMSADQLSLAFERHATSKLRALSDLERVTGYGFRGEALPSIVAAAEVVCLSRATGQPLGTRLSFRGGAAGKAEPVGAPVGTSMEITELFARQPARRKFLAGARSERAAIARVCSEAALAHPEIALTLELGGRRLLASPGRSGGERDREAELRESELRGAFAAVWGADVADGAIWFEGHTPIEGSEAGEVTLWGLAAAPTQHRGRRNGVQLFVNGRPVQSSRLGYAVEQAYAELLPSRRYPIVALFLRLPGDRVDVNVHPSKATVKLRDEGALFGVVQERLRAALLDGAGVRPYAGAVQAADGGPAGETGAADGERRAARTLAGAGERTEERTTRGPDGGGGRSADGGGDLQATASLPGLPILRLLGQLRSTFIVAEGPQGMVLIDQHAAHERVTYERLLAARNDANDAATQQALLDPPLLELSVAQAAALAQHVEALSAFGFSLEPFGDRSLRLRAVPACFGERDARASLTAVLDDLAGEERRAQRNDPVAASTACHSSVRAGQTLKTEEMSAVLRDLEQCDNPHSCPHGRPTLVEFATRDLLRQFGRT